MFAHVAPMIAHHVSLWLRTMWMTLRMLPHTHNPSGLPKCLPMYEKFHVARCVSEMCKLECRLQNTQHNILRRTHTMIWLANNLFWPTQSKRAHKTWRFKFQVTQTSLWGRTSHMITGFITTLVPHSYTKFISEGFNLHIQKHLNEW